MFRFEDRTEGKIIKNRFITIGRQIENNKTCGIYLLFKNPKKFKSSYVDPETFEINEKIMQNQYMWMIRKNSMNKFKWLSFKVAIPLE